MCLWSVPSSAEIAVHINAASQRYKQQAAEFVYLGATVTAYANISADIKRRISATRARQRKNGSQVYDRPDAQLPLTIRLLRAEVVKAMP